MGIKGNAGRREYGRSVTVGAWIRHVRGSRRLAATVGSMLALSLAMVPVIALGVTSTASAVSVFSPATLPSSVAAPYTDPRPSSCPPPTAAQLSDSATPGQTGTTTGSIPWPPLPSGTTDPATAAAADHTPVQSPPLRPSNWSLAGSDWMLSSARSSNSQINRNPQELCGVKGNSVDTAWQTTTGSPSTLIAVTDSGIEWCDPGLVGKIYINPAALPLPENASGKTKVQLEASGVKFAGPDPYDLNNSGVVNVFQYANDPRVAAVVKDYGGYFCSAHTHNNYGYTGISPMDLIRTFGTPDLPDGQPNPYYYGHSGPAGFTEAISGWNFVNNDNNPYDVVHYDHGTGEASDSAAAANSLAHRVGVCPNCMILPVRVGDSFIVSGNAFAEGVLFAVDSGASLIQDGLGSLNITETDRQAVAYAQAHGVPIVASAADEESQHHNLPALLSHTIVVNSLTKAPSGPNGPLLSPASYLYLNGCTNYGANMAVSAESLGCSSEATGKTSGMVGLIESEAAAALAAHKITAYPGLTTVTGKPVALSVNEVRQIVTMTASDVNFQTAAPPYGPANNYKVSAPVPTTRYPTQPGFDIYTGYGRTDTARAVQWVSKGWIPPQAEITGMPWFNFYSPSGTLAINGIIGTPRACPGQPASATPCPWSYQVQVGIGAQPEPTAWHAVASGSGTGVKQGRLADIPLSSVAQLFPASVRNSGFTGGPVTSTGSPQDNKFTFTVRVVVQDSGSVPLVGMSRRAAFMHSTGSLLYSAPLHFNSSIDASPTLAPIGPHGENVLLVATTGGSIYAMQPNGSELPGWPVHTAVDSGYHPGEAAYTSGAVLPPRAEPLDISGGIAVGDLANASAPCLHGPNPNGSCLDVMITDWTGRVYAWNAQGQMLPGFPVRTDPAYSAVGVANPDNRVQRGIVSSVALADLQGNGQLDVVASAMDRHLYAWQPDGQPVPGFPVLVVDPSKVASVNPVNGQVTFTSSSNVMQGTKLVDTPAVGNLNGGSGPPDLVLGSNEQYSGPLNAQIGALAGILKTFGSSANFSTANGRVYAVYPDGSLHPAAPGSPDPPGYPNPGAILPGWPASVADVLPNTLPDVGDGVVSSPALADVSGNGKLEVGVAADAGPAYLLQPNGTSALGTTPSGLYNVTAVLPPGSTSNSLQGMLSMSAPSLGDIVFAPLQGSAGGMDLVAPALSFGEALDQALPADQIYHNYPVDAWNASTGQMLPGFSALTNGMQFFNQPIVANVASGGPYIVEASSVYDLRAYNAKGVEAPGYPKFTGGWVVNSATFGSFGSLATKVLAAGTREGFLFVWKSSTSTCSGNGPWPMAHHDLWNTNNLQTTGAPATPATPACLAAQQQAVPSHPAQSVTTPAVHTGEPWSGWDWWLLDGLIAAAGMLLIWAGYRRRAPSLQAMSSRRL